MKLNYKFKFQSCILVTFNNDHTDHVSDNISSESNHIYLLMY